MANIPIWDNNPGPISGSTPFRFYDTDTAFQTEGPLFATWCARRLGYPIVNIELQDINFYAALEEAVTQYGNEVYQWKIREGYLAMEGNVINNNETWNTQVVTPNLGSIIRIAENYASEAGVGGYTTYYTGSLTLQNGVQDYDLKSWASASGISGSGIEIKKIFFEAPPAIVRYFDPYAGTGTGIQSLLESFGFGQFSPGINFLLMPINFDVQRIQAIELNDEIRRADFSFDIINNQLRIFPIPNVDRKLFFEYAKISEKSNPVSNTRPNIVTDVMNVPYRNPIYSNINAVGRTWIFKYTLALCREIEAHIRIQYSNLNIQGVGPLQGSELISDARTEKENLLTELKEMLNEVSRRGQLERKQQEAQFTRDTMQNIPMTIYIM